MELERLKAVRDDGLFAARTLSMLYAVDDDTTGVALQQAVARLCQAAVDAVDDGDTVIILSDRGIDARLAAMVAEYLQLNDFSIERVGDGLSGLARLRQAPNGAPPVDLVVLDLMLPDIDGLEVCRRIRALSGALGQTPVLMLTAKGDPMDRIVGLELGADDYLPKPFEPRELLARIRAVLRRKTEFESAAGEHALLRYGSLEIDRDARTVTVAGVPSELTSYQFDLLVTLAERAGRVLTRDQIMEAVRGRELDAFDRSIDVHMGRIRAAIEQDPKTPKRILTVRGVGYVFARQQD
jgi:DNA-binding response OmpR family regulator